MNKARNRRHLSPIVEHRIRRIDRDLDKHMRIQQIEIRAICLKGIEDFWRQELARH